MQINIFEMPLYQDYIAGRPQTRPFKGEEGMFDAMKAEVASLKETIKTGGAEDAGSTAGASSGAGAMPGGRKFAEQSAEEKAEAFRRMIAGGSGPASGSSKGSGDLKKRK